MSGGPMDASSTSGPSSGSASSSTNKNSNSNAQGAASSNNDRLFSLKKWNAVAMWSWDVECDTCAICRVQVIKLFIHQKGSFLNNVLLGDGRVPPVPGREQD